MAPRSPRVGYRGNHRIFTTVDVDAEGRGDLVLVDPDSLAEFRIDGHALPLTPFFDWDTLLNGPERDMIVYQVLDDERSGVWIARPAAE